MFSAGVLTHSHISISIGSAGNIDTGFSRIEIMGKSTKFPKIFPNKTRISWSITHNMNQPWKTGGPYMNQINQKWGIQPFSQNWGREIC